MMGGRLFNPQRLQRAFIRWRAHSLVNFVGMTRSRTTRKVVYIGDGEVLVRNVFGHDMYLSAKDQSLTPALIMDGYWEPHVAHYLSRVLRPGMTVVEVGANVGFFTLLAAACVGETGQVHSFEANPDVAGRTLRTIAINNYLDRVSFNHLAVADQCTTLTLHRLRRHHGNSNISGFSREYLDKAGDEVERVEVQATTLDHYFEGLTSAQAPYSIDLLKMDVEGAEPRVLKGMPWLLAQQPPKQILLEFCPRMLRQAGHDPGQFVTDLERAGYHTHVLSGRGRPRPITRAPLLEVDHVELVLSR